MSIDYIIRYDNGVFRKKRHKNISKTRKQHKKAKKKSAKCWVLIEMFGIGT